MAITIGRNLTRPLLETDGDILPRYDVETPPSVIVALEEHLPDFTKSYRENALAPEEFHDFGPVAGFQSTFLKGWETLLVAISARRAAATGIAEG
jgi:hypothetical protein